MEERKCIAIFGGAFNPPLNSHLEIAKEVLRTCSNVEKVIFVPVNSKYNKEGLVSNEHRYNMIKILCKNNEDLLLSTIELDSNRPLYTIETLEHMQLEYMNHDICLLMGSDNLKELAEWKEAERLVNEFKIIVVKRGFDNIGEIIKEDSLLNNYQENFIKMENNKYEEFNSTNVRDMIKKGEDISSFMPVEILEYIKENKLYIEGE